MKKILTLLLALTMAFALVACGGDDDKVPDDTTDGADEAAVLRVAMECAYAPYNWTQTTDEHGAVPIDGTESDYVYGYDVMMAKLIADELDMELEIVALEWGGIIPAIQSGSVDLGICGQSVTAARLEMVDFTTPYYYATIVALVKADGPYADATSVADLAGASVTSQANTIWDTVCVPQIADTEILAGQSSAPAMTVALISDRVEVVITDQPTGLAAVAAQPDLKMLEFVGDDAFVVSQEDINIGISIKKGNDELRESINEVLSTMTEDDFKTMMNEAIAVQPLAG